MSIEQEKSIALAELMGCKQPPKDTPFGIVAIQGLDGECETLCPYDPSQIGLAQFAAILLKALKEDGLLNPQKSILDSILRDGGKWKEKWDE